ncbi:MAG: hypothetical protein ACOCXG_00325 [Nanoarchaeota archaeon]
MRKSILFALGLIFMIVGVNACSCAFQDNVTDKYNMYGEIFTGKVTSIDKNRNEYEITIQLIDIYKGENVQVKTLHTAIESAACGYDFEEGENYLIYANEYENKLSTDLCSGNSLVSKAENETQILETLAEKNPENIFEKKEEKGFFAKIIDFFKSLFTSEKKNEENSAEKKIEEIPVENIPDTQNTFCTMEYAPVCASVQVQCVRAPCPPINQTFSNACMAKTKDATVLYKGECEN